METVRAEQLRFYDGGGPGERPRRDEPPRIVLEQRERAGEEVFALLRRVGYADRHLGQLLVPADPATFTTDLTSVPSVLTWLVPRSGRHLPAALVHDALVADPAEPGETGVASYVSERGVAVDRVEADRVFRDAMADTGTGVVRRWLAWSAVTLVTLWVAPPLRAFAQSAEKWRKRIAAKAEVAARRAELVDRFLATQNIRNVGLG